MQTLIDYSQGSVSQAMAMQALGLDDYGQLLLALNGADVPHPILPLATRQKMAARMVAMLRGAEASS